MIITVDGLDGCGKSTLAKKLATRLNFKYIDKPIYQLFGVSGDDNPLYKEICQIQSAVYDKTESDRLKAWFTGLSLLYIKEVLGSQNLVVDRGMLSCIAFNGNEYSEEIFETLIKLGVWFDVSIFLYASTDIRKKRIIDRNPSCSDLFDAQIMNMTYNSVNSFIKRHKELPLIFINTDNISENEVFDLAISELCKCKDVKLPI